MRKREGTMIENWRKSKRKRGEEVPTRGERDEREGKENGKEEKRRNKGKERKKLEKL